MLAVVLAFAFASCGDTNSDHVHSFDAQNLDAKYLKSEANCSDPATYYYSCSCGERGEKTFTAGSAIGHDYTKATLVTAATCDKAAVYKVVCSRCEVPNGKTFTSGDPLSHSYIEAVIDSALKSEATCSAAAEYYKSCSRCKVNSTETFTNGKALEHSYVSEVREDALVTEATCTKGATYYESCSVCGELGENVFGTAETLPHVLTHVPFKDATATENGNREYWVCSECENYFADENGETLIENKADVFIPSAGHAHAYNVKNTSADYLSSAATCTKKALYFFSCECGEAGTETFEDGEPLPHSYDKIVNADCIKSQATCTEAAVYYESCSECGAKNTEKTFTYGDLAAHASVTHYDEVAATCTTSGNLEYWRCVDCGKYFTDSACMAEVKYTALITTTSHNYGEVVHEDYLKSDATCQSPAIYHKSCTDCGVASQNDTFTVGEAVDCVFVAIEGSTVAPTCQSEGYTVYRCTFCDTTERRDVTDKLTHLANYEVTVVPGCGTTGKGVYTCDNCADRQEVVLPALDHSYEATDVKANTCESGGYTTYTCSTCGDSYISDITEATGHDFVETERVDATCTADGYVLEVCQHDNSHTNVTVLSDRPDHSYTDATCTEDSVCSECGAFGSARFGHEWVVDESKRVAPTCEGNGSEWYDCDRCDETKTEDIVPTGHTFVWGDEVNELIDADTCTYQTVQHGVCACGEEDTKYGEETVIHSYVFIIKVEATCTTDGLKEYTCTACGHVKETEDSDYYSAPEAHSYDADGKCACGKTKVVISDTSADVSADDLKNELEFTDASLSIDETTQSQLGDKNVNLTVGTVDEDAVNQMASTLTPEQQELLAGKTVYNFEMSADGEPVINFDGTITIKIPYELGDEDPDDIVVWYLAVVVDEEGNPVLDEFGNVKHEPKLVQAKYIEIDGQGYAVFETNHFSYYTVTKLTAAERCEKFGHNWLVTNVTATCMTNGYTLHSCLRCGLKEFSNQVDPLGHEFVLDEQTFVALTCTTDGYAEYACSRCQVSYEEIAKSTGHVWESVSKTDASCTEAGVESFKCASCDAERSVTVPKLPHNYTENTVEATCTTAGHTTKTCVDCNYTVITDRVDPLGHNDEEIVHAPTCLAQGYTEHYCDRCDEVFKTDSYKNKVNHEWNIDEPTCEEDKKCVHCNKLDESATNKGHALGHNYKKGVCQNCLAGCDHENVKYSHDQKPTCTEVGYKLYLCASCHNFVKGEEIEMVEHSLHKVEEFEATCIRPAYTVSRCNKCKGEFVEEHGEPSEHSYAGGVCTYCGKDNNNFYLNLINSIFQNKGFAIRVNDFTFVYEECYNTSEFVTEGYINAINVNELMIYFDEESGITGAAQFNIVIFNGPVDGEVTVSVKALIENGYAYVELTSDVKEMNGNVRYSIDDFIDMMLSEMTGLEPSDAMTALDTVVEEVLPLLTVLAEDNAKDIESVLASVFDMLFSYENVDGNYVYTLDFDKLHAINANLKDMRIDAFVDFYFGEGAFDSVYSTLKELLDLRVCDIPAYAEGLGISEADLIAAINTVCHDMLGAPEEFDIADVFASEEAAEYTVGMLLMRGEYDSAQIDEYVSVIRATTVYALMSEGDLELEGQMFDMIEQIIDAVDGIVDYSFTTDKNGTVLSFSVSVDECVLSQSNYSKYTGSIDLSFVFGDVIDVDWDSIIDDTEDKIAVFPELDDEISVETNRHGSTEGSTYTENGSYYEYYGMYYTVYKRVSKLSAPMGYAIFPECNNWYGYSLLFQRESYEFSYMLAMVKTESGNQYMLVRNHDFDRATRLLVDEKTGEVTYFRPDGATGTFYIDMAVEGFTPEQLELCFGEIDWYTNVYTTSDTYYCNIETGELLFDNPHRYVVTETKEPENCGVDGYHVYTCEYCGDFYYSYFNNFSHEYVIDEEKSSLPTECEQEGYMVRVCIHCGESYTERVYMNHTFVYEYQLHEGSETCEDGVDYVCKCKYCGYVNWTDEYFTYSHNIKSEFTYEDGSIYRSQACSACDYAEDSNYYCTVEAEGATVTLVDGIQKEEKPNYSYGNGGSGGNMGWDEEHNDGRFYLAIVVDEDAVFEMYAHGEYYSYATLYGENGAHLVSNSYGALNDNFGILYELKAGVTYTLAVSDADATTVYIKPHDDSKDVVFNHSDYGCECGAVTTLVYAFNTVKLNTVNNSNPEYDYAVTPKYDYAINDGGAIYDESYNVDDGAWDDGGWDDGKENEGEYGDVVVKTCVLNFNLMNNWSTDENCNEITIPEVWLHNMSTGDYVNVYTGEPVYTGNRNHWGATGNYFDENGEITDDDGNLLTYNHYGWEYKCDRCYETTSKEEYYNYYDANGNRVKYESKYYTTENGELYMYESRTYEYEFVSTDYGTYERETLDDYRRYNSAGNLIEYSTRTRVYEGCQVTETFESSYDKSYTEVRYNHTEDTKIVEEETNYDYVNDDGFAARLETYEIYCKLCAASIRKYSYEYAYDDEGNTIKYIYRNYQLYANSEDDYGYELSEMEVTTNTVFEYLPGKYISRQTSYRRETYGEDGEVNYWEQWTRDYSSVCEYYYTFDNIYGSHNEYDGTQHDMVYEYRLHDGAVSCLDGIDMWRVCRYCDYEKLYYENYYSSHQINANCEKQGTYYNLADYGSQCGGYVYVYTCPCEERYDVRVSCDCDMNHTSRWPGDKMDHNVQTWACSVTNTADGFTPCGFIYTYENWIETDENCLGTRYYRYTFGVGSENPLVIEWSVNTNSYYHNTEYKSVDTLYYIDGEYEVYVNGYKYVCRQCGLTTSENADIYYVDASCRVVIREHVSKSYRNSDGTLNHESMSRYELLVNPVNGQTGEYHVGNRSISYQADGVTVSSASEDVYERIWVYSEDGTEARSVTAKEEHRNYYSADSYANKNVDYWYRYEYDFTDCVCQPRRIYKDSNGANRDDGINYYDHYGYTDYYWVVEPTCTQSGIEGYACRWCDYESTWNYGAFGHNYHYVGSKDDETSIYRCSRCELENFTGYDGTIVLEDLTWKLGEGENYAIGYYVSNSSSYSIYVEVMLGDGPDADSVLLNDYIEMTDTGSVLYVNIESLKSAIANMAAALGEEFSICTNMVRISFVPDYNEYDFDYAITLDPHIRSYSANAGVDGAMPSTHSAACTECGECIIESKDCSWVLSYRDSVIEDGIKYEIITYTCRYCDNSYTVTTWSELTDSTSCTYTRYEKTEWAGGENTVEVDTYQQHNYSYSFNADTVGEEIFQPTHSYVCADCGESGDTGSCMNSGNSFSYVEDGVKYEVQYHHCYRCHFAFKRLSYSELTDSSECEYTNYVYYLWNRNSECVFESSYLTTSTYTEHVWEYSHIDGDGESVPNTHTSYCTRCSYTQEDYCNSNMTEENVMIDGINHRIYHYTCYDCGFTYDYDYYFISDDECTTTEYYTSTWVDASGEEKSITSTYVGKNHIGSFSFRVDEDGRIVRVFGCKCGESISEASITMNTPYDVELYTDHASRYFIFAVTVDTTSVYSFYSRNYTNDTHGYVYDADGKCLADNDDGGEDLNFHIDIELEAGKTYYLCTRFHGEWNSNDYYEGSYDVYFDHVSIN